MALGLPLPKQVLGHPWVLVGEDKMSKSKGNVIYADELAKRFSADAVRYYLLSEIPFAQDGTITYESFINKFNADLANTLGNLVNRTVAMTNKYFDGTVSFKETDNELDKDLIATANDTVKRYFELMDIYHNADAVSAVMNLAKRCNKYIDETTPWALAKDEGQKDRLNTVLYNLLECVRLLAVMLTPVMPESCDSIRQQIGEQDTSLTFGEVKKYTVGAASPLFARIDAEKVLAEIEAEQKAAKEAEEAANVATIAEIGIEDFAKVELTAAKIVECEAVPKAKKLLKLTLNDGKRNRTVASGIAKFYTPEELVGKTVILVSNLKKAKLCGIESEGMILAADCGEDNIKVIFLEDVPAGRKIR